MCDEIFSDKSIAECVSERKENWLAF